MWQRKHTWLQKYVNLFRYVEYDILFIFDSVTYLLFKLFELKVVKIFASPVFHNQRRAEKRV